MFSDFNLSWDAAHIVNDTMIRLDAGKVPAIARDSELLNHTNEVAERMILSISKSHWDTDQRSIDNAILLAEANQAELLADYGVLRRQAFRRLLKSHMERMIKDPKMQEGGVVLMMSDGNGLKTINDNLNHYWGDRFVKMWADQLTKHMRQGSGDVFFQHASGDEIAAFLRFESAEIAEAVMGYDFRSGRINDIKSDIFSGREELIREIEVRGNRFPLDPRGKEIGTLAIGWNWMSNKELLAMYNRSKHDPEEMIGRIYEEVENKMKVDKGSNQR